MAKKISKQELKTPDPFLKKGAEVAQVLENKWPLILGGFLAVVAVGAAYVGYTQWNKYQELQAQEDLFVWVNKIEQKQKDWFEKEQASMNPEKPTEASGFKGDFEADFSPLVSGLEQEIKSHKSTVAAQAAAMKLADFLAEHERVDQASQLLMDVEASVSDSDWLYGLYKVQLASLLSQKGQTQDALERLEKLTDVKAASFLHPEVYLKIGLLYEQLGQVEKAQDVYARVSTDYGDTEAGKTAQSYSRLLEIQQNLGGASQQEQDQTP